MIEEKIDKEKFSNHSIKVNNDILYTLMFKDIVKNIDVKHEFELDNEKYKDRVINVLLRKDFGSYKDLEYSLKTEFQEEINDIVWDKAKEIIDGLYSKGLCISYKELCDDPDYASLDILVSLLNNFVFFNKDKVVDMLLNVNSKYIDN